MIGEGQASNDTVGGREFDMAQNVNPRGLEELNALAERSRTRDRVLVDLRERDFLLELESNRAWVVTVELAPDGAYELQRSGKLLVKSGKAADVIGKPDAVAVGDSIG